MIKKLNFYILFLSLFPVSLYAQGGGSSGVTDAVSAGLANSSTATSKGIYCIGKNPANLIYNQDEQIE